MIVHILGWLTVASTAVTAIFTARWLQIASQEALTWRRKLRVPKLAREHTPLQDEWGGLI